MRTIENAVVGLFEAPKRLPFVLFYDERGSALFEQITQLPEYYLTRAEREILEARAETIVELAAAGERLSIVELGAGSGIKTQLLLRAVVRSQGSALYLPIDVSAAALEAARARLAREEPAVEVRPLVASHDQGLEILRRLPGRRLVLFIGSSIGNYEDEEAVALLTSVRRALELGDTLLLGTDLRKDPQTLVAAYDDSAGVTAEFNMNLLRRINAELGANFSVDRFRHVAIWNPEASRVEMYLESLVDQQVHIAALGAEVRFEAGERVHTESCIKYDRRSSWRLIDRAGFELVRTFHDSARRFAVHLARAAVEPW